MSSLEVTNEQSKAVQKTPNRVDLSDIENKIETIEYHSPKFAPHMTIAIVKLTNGYIVTGESTPADPENYDENLGRQFAYEAAVRKIWPLEGYALREKLAA